MPRVILLSLFFFASRGMGSELQFRIIDSETGEAIRKRPVQLILSNTIRCVRAPCPSNQESKATTSDSDGTVKIGPHFFGRETETIGVKVKGYLPKKVDRKSFQEILLRPKSRGQSFREIELRNYDTDDVLKMSSVVIENQSQCGKKECEKTVVFSGKTNVYGLVYFEYLKVFPKGLSQTRPVLLKVKGFETYKLYQHHRGILKLRPL